MEASDDLALLREYAANNSEKAFETLVGRHVRLVYSAAWRQTGDTYLAEEITQAVFIILAKKAGQVSGGTILSGWLYKTTRFVALAQNRMRARRRQLEQEFHMETEAQSTTPGPLWEQIAPLLDQALLQLRDKDRQALLLRFFENKSLAEIGGAFGRGEDAARMRINRALKKLERYFNRRGISSTTELLAETLATNSMQLAPAALVKSACALAVAQGAAASASTLTLIQGALKLMAWTKAKSVLLAGLAALLIGGAGLVTLELIHAARRAHYPNIQGAWEGVMLMDEAAAEAGQAANTRVVLKLTQSNGVYRATTDWIEMGRRDVPMGRVIYEYPSLRIERSVRDTWNLNVNGEATEMVLEHSIHFIQPAPVRLRRTASPDRVPEPLAENEFTPRADSDLQGYWKGAIATDGDALPVVLKIAEQPGGTFRAEGDVPMMGTRGRPISVTYHRPTVTLKVATGSGTFEGEIDRANTKISGAWVQEGIAKPATLLRSDYLAEHAQDPLRDYSFHSPSELQGHWKGSWVVTIANVKATIRLALDIAKLPDGSYSAALANIDEFGHDAPMPTSDFEFDPPQVRMQWKWAGGGYEGRLLNGRLAGAWLQAGGRFPLVFERSGSK